MRLRPRGWLVGVLPGADQFRGGFRTEALRGYSSVLDAARVSTASPVDAGEAVRRVGGRYGGRMPQSRQAAHSSPPPIRMSICKKCNMPMWLINVEPDDKPDHDRRTENGARPRLRNEGRASALYRP